MQGQMQVQEFTDRELDRSIEMLQQERARRKVRADRPLATEEDPSNRTAIAGEWAGQDAEKADTAEADVDWVFSYHAPSPLETAKYRSIRTAAKFFATILLENVPRSTDRTDAIRKLRECVMTANAAIALRGRSL